MLPLRYTGGMSEDGKIQLVADASEAGLPMDRLLLRHQPDMTRNKIRAMLARQLADEEGRLHAIVASGKRNGDIDPALSTEAIVTLCHAIGLGFLLRRVVDRPLPAADEWNGLVERLIGAVTPATDQGDS